VCAIAAPFGPLSVAGVHAEGIVEAIAPNEPTDACENVTNEPTEGLALGVASALSQVGCDLGALGAAKTSEPTLGQ
jgi:hypothetical protein